LESLQLRETCPMRLHKQQQQRDRNRKEQKVREWVECGGRGGGWKVHKDSPCKCSATSLS